MSESKEAYTELNAEKLNIVDKKGTVKMTLFSQDHIPPLLMDGEDILPGHRQNDPISGIIFYNGRGEECGGLIFGSGEDEEGNVFAGASLTFDQYQQDQVVQMYFEEENGERSYGFSLFDRPDRSLAEQIKEQNEITASDWSEERKNEEIQKVFAGHAPRAFMGKERNGDVSVKLMDSKGHPRIRLVVDKSDVPRMQFLNEEGEVTYQLPPE